MVHLTSVLISSIKSFTILAGMTLCLVSIAFDDLDHIVLTINNIGPQYARFLTISTTSSFTLLQRILDLRFGQLRGSITSLRAQRKGYYGYIYFRAVPLHKFGPPIPGLSNYGSSNPGPLGLGR